MKRYRSSGFIAAFILLFFLLTVVSGCGGQMPSPPADGEQVEPVKFKLGHANRVGYGPLYIARELGFFTNYNIEPELLIIEESEYSTAVTSAVTSGQLQGLADAVDREVILSAADAPITLVLALGESAGGTGIAAKQEITGIQDLKGATVGVDKSSAGYYFLLSVLRNQSVSEDDVLIQEMGTDDAGEAFVAGRVDAAVVGEPWLTNASLRPGGHVLVSSADFPGTIVDAIALRRDFAEQHPKAVTGLVKAWFDAVEFYKHNPDQGQEIIARAMNLDPEEVAERAKGARFFSRDENVNLFADPGNKDGIYELTERIVELWKEKGMISADAEVSKIIDPRFIEEASNQ